MATTTLPMLFAHPGEITADRDRVARAIDALVACAQMCTACAAACLSESTVSELARCVRMNIDCADVCDTTARVLARHAGSATEISRALLKVCASVCQVCGEECKSHSGAHKHCGICARSCHACEQACHELLAVLN